MPLKPLRTVVLQGFSLREELCTLTGIQVFGGTYSLVQLECEFVVLQGSIEFFNESPFYSMTVHRLMSSSHPHLFQNKVSYCPESKP